MLGLFPVHSSYGVIPAESAELVTRFLMSTAYLMASAQISRSPSASWCVPCPRELAWDSQQSCSPAACWAPLSAASCCSYR